MMDWGNGDWGWGWGAWVVMTASMVLFWGLVAWVIVTVVRRPDDKPVAPEEVLAGRFARGEIEEDEYRRRRDALRSTP